MRNRRSVALLIETSNAYARGLLQGIMQYLREQARPWSIHLFEQGRGDSPPAWLKNWKGEGIIARIENQRIARVVTNTGLPIVDVSAARLVPGVAWVETHDEAIARLAADHLLERGFTNFAFCGDSAFNWSNWRRDHFVRYLQQQGFDCAVFDSSSTGKRRQTADREHEKLAHWLRELPKPIGVMACYDIKAQQLLDTCRGIGIAVPEELAVIGVDNDELLCNLSFPPLSSVVPNSHRTGYEAALLLDRLMDGKQVPPEAHLIEPLGIATRRSTDVLAIEDRDVAAAVRFIREHVYEGIHVSDVLKAIPLTRRVLEKRFRQIMGRTPHEEIVRLKIERVKQLLVETDLSMSQIAERSGFRHVEYMSVAFKKNTGLPPSEFRAQQV